MGENNGDFPFTTFIVFGLISLIFYLMYRPQPRPSSTSQAPPAAKEPSRLDKLLAECVKCPPHVSQGSQAHMRAGGSNLLADGMIAFRHSRAAGFEQSSEEAATNRKDRARALSRMLVMEQNSTTASPPQLGSTLIISIPEEELACPKLRRVLFLFASYYNLLVIMAVSCKINKEGLSELRQKVRGNSENPGTYISASLLPDHRLVAASTAEGRIAFVRQMARAEITLDFDAEVREELDRFGYRVIQYGENAGTLDAGFSRLGTQLLA